MKRSETAGRETILSCATPRSAEGDRIVLAHGEGGRTARRLIEETIVPRLGAHDAAVLDDAARLPAVSGELALTTDSFVVSPLFFPGGDIGSLAVYGTVNDLAVAGAHPLWLSLGLIIEEGLPRETLERILDSIATAARHASVRVATGDTKVVQRGAADGIFINTSGIGHLVEPVPPGPAALVPGDEILVTGPVGQHGIAVLAARNELFLDPAPTSDVAPLADATAALRAAGIMPRAMRDATRGGVAAVLHEWASASGSTLAVDGDAVPISDEVRGACELLGIDPLHVSCEGVMVVAVKAGQAAATVQTLAGVPETCGACLIGRVEPRSAAAVTTTGALGVARAIDEPSGAPFPRIC